MAEKIEKKETNKDEMKALVEASVAMAFAEANKLSEASKTLAIAEAEKELKLREEIRKEEKEKLEAEVAAWKSVGTKKVTKAGSDQNEQTRVMLHWLRTGDEVPARKALQEGDDAEGGYLCPEDLLTTIQEKRRQLSWVDKVGVQKFSTKRDIYKIDTEATAYSIFDIVAEEGTIGDSDPAFGQLSCTIYKFNKLTKASTEVLEDNDANLESWLSRSMAKAWGDTLGHYVAVGTGTAQPQGVFTGGDTDALTFDCTGDILAPEIPELLYKLNNSYRSQPSSAWLMKGTTEAALRGVRDANNWAFPAGPMSTGNGIAFNGLAGLPCYNESAIDAISTGKGVICVGDWSYYALVERHGMRLQRLVELYAVTGQVGLLATVRFGGGVIQEEAFAIGQMASS